MHRALMIPEVAEIVCCHLLPKVHDAKIFAEIPRGRKTLLALASTCKVLQEPALDVLWKNQESLAPFLSCLPEDLFNTRPALASEEVPLRLLRPFAPPDWRRSILNATRVKKFTFEFEPRFAQIFPALTISFPLGCIFPRLRSLSWVSNSEKDFPCIRSFLTPELLHIAITFEPSIVNCSLLSTLACTCPRLVDAEIYFVDGSDVLDPLSVNSTSQFLQSLRRIESLIIPALDATALKHIGQGEIEFLCLDILPDGPYSRSPASLPLFRHLRRLELHSAVIPVVIAVLEMCAQISLKSLYLAWDDIYPAAETEELYLALTTYCSKSCFRTLTLSCIGGNTSHISGDDAGRYAVNSRMLQALFCFQKWSLSQSRRPYNSRSATVLSWRRPRVAASTEHRARCLP
ncbi:hypothetical protein B0H19DRAFT_1161415 [Mycena capillaripes]|nr:hypothetical protein B0H19DRAFT_1161415 [Mycena capillaripes]